MPDQPVALVTGASSGIGEQAALGLHRAGFAVHAVARRVERMSGLADAGVHVCGMDVTDDDSVLAGVTRVTAMQGRIDVLVNNAGYGSYGALENVSIDEARRQFEVNVFGLARLTQLVIPYMREQGSGKIINVSSIGGKFYEPLGSWYHASKFAVEGLSDSLRLELRRFGINVVLIEPAAIVSEWNKIARQKMTGACAGTPYAATARHMAGLFERASRPPLSSRPEVVARKIVHVARARHPRARYPVGRGAGTILAARRLLPDRAFDAVIGAAYRV
jgi:NAD(P)-dependent dehydrogenase (short-subunit alcohol dehydrogenase family)